MTDVFNEAYGIVQCRECPWYKTCAVPMKFTAEDLRRQMEQSQMGIPGQPDMITNGSMDMQNFFSSMASAAQNSLLEGCPVFIERLRNSPKLAQRIKELMRNWSQEE